MVLLGLTCVLPSCAGYKMGADKPAKMAGVTTLAIPVFKNLSLEPRSSVIVTNNVIKRFQMDPTYKITDTKSADAVLKGTIQKFERRQLRGVRSALWGHRSTRRGLRCRKWGPPPAGGALPPARPATPPNGGTLPPRRPATPPRRMGEPFRGKKPPFQGQKRSLEPKSGVGRGKTASWRASVAMTRIGAQTPRGPLVRHSGRGAKWLRP